MRRIQAAVSVLSRNQLHFQQGEKRSSAVLHSLESALLVLRSRAKRVLGKAEIVATSRLYPRKHAAGAGRARDAKIGLSTTVVQNNTVYCLASWMATS
jgi:hypothetical protein